MLYVFLFADAEVFENVAEDGFDVEWVTYDFGEVPKAFAEVLWHEVAWELHLQAVLNTMNRVKGTHKSFVVS